MPKEIEIRAVNESAKKQGSAEEQTRTVEGYGIVYNTQTELFPGYFEQINRGAFDLSENQEVKSYFNHDSRQVLSTTKSVPPLVLTNDDHGLYYRSPIPPTSYGKDLEINLERNNVSGASFAFVVDSDTWEERSDGSIFRSIEKARLYEIGPVTSPAYIQTGASLRQTQEIVTEKRESLRNKSSVTSTVAPKPDVERNKNILDLELRKLEIETQII